MRKVELKDTLSSVPLNPSPDKFTLITWGLIHSVFLVSQPSLFTFVIDLIKHQQLLLSYLKFQFQNQVDKI